MINERIEQKRRWRIIRSCSSTKGKAGERVFQISVKMPVSTNHDKANDKIPNIHLQYLNYPVYEARLHEELDPKPSVKQ